MIGGHGLPLDDELTGIARRRAFWPGYTRTVFTGIVQGVGSVVALQGHRLVVRHDEVWPGDPVCLGESVAVDGCCLTVVGSSAKDLLFDLSGETLARTCMGGLAPGSGVNLERAMKASDRLGGHIVQGHVDCTGEIVTVQKAPDSWVVKVAVPTGGQYLAPKGSVCVSGVSLTVVDPVGASFDVHLVPHTVSVTNLAGWSQGTCVNIEFDAIAKHVENLLAWRS